MIDCFQFCPENAADYGMVTVMSRNDPGFVRIELGGLQHTVKLISWDAITFIQVHLNLFWEKGIFLKVFRQIRIKQRFYRIVYILRFHFFNLILYFSFIMLISKQ